MVTWEKVGDEWHGKGNYMEYRIRPNDKSGFRAEQTTTRQGKNCADEKAAKRWCEDHNKGY